jgi:pimeloyl-ACP methyl ester carboxylesterase
LVIVPGIMGSKLRERDTGRIVWGDFSSIPLNPLKWDAWLDHLFAAMTYPNPQLAPAGIMDEVVFVPPWAKQEQYSRLVKALEGLGYRVDPPSGSEGPRDAYTFPYDWRQDNRLSARELAQAIDRWGARHPQAQAWIIAHSNGGLVSRWYIEKEGGNDRVGRLFLMGSPWDGAPKTVHILFGGLETLFRRGFDRFHIPEHTRELFRTFPCAYQLVPVQNPFLRDLHNEAVDPFSDVRWLANEGQRALLLDGRRFNQDLGTMPSVETLCFFGRKKPTTTYGLVRYEPAGGWSDIEWHATEAGDGTVPERSAVHPQAQAKLPFAAGHGDIYVHPAVLEVLQWELGDKYREPGRASLTTPQTSVLFEPDDECYAPGELMRLAAQVLGPEDEAGRREPVPEAQIAVELAWRGPLPGDAPRGAPPAPLWTRLSLAGEPGRYVGSLQAPGREGYYELRALVEAPGEAPLALSELLVVEKEP